MGILFRFLEPPESNSIYRSGSCVPRNNNRVRYQRVIVNSNTVLRAWVYTEEMGLPSGGHPLLDPYLSLVFLQEAQR